MGAMAWVQGALVEHPVAALENRLRAVERNSLQQSWHQVGSPTVKVPRSSAAHNIAWSVQLFLFHLPLCVYAASPVKGAAPQPPFAMPAPQERSMQHGSHQHPWRAGERRRGSAKLKHGRCDPQEPKARDWGCNLFAARLTKAAEDSMLHMPLPQPFLSQLHLFATLSAVVLWLKFRCIQACSTAATGERILHTAVSSCAPLCLWASRTSLRALGRCVALRRCMPHMHSAVDNARRGRSALQAKPKRHTACMQTPEVTVTEHACRHRG
jgi:hypothetical protein